MSSACWCDDSSFLDEETQFVRQRLLHPCVFVVESEEYGVELAYCGGTIVHRQDTILPVPRQVYETWRAFRDCQYPRDAQSRTRGLACLKWSLYSLICFGPLCCWISDEYLEARRKDHFRRHHLLAGYRVEITRLDSTYCDTCLPEYGCRMYVSQEVYEATAEEDLVYQGFVRAWERKQQNEERRHEQQHAEQKRQQDRQLARPEARQQLSSLQESTVKEVLISCDLNDEELAYAQHFRQEGITSVQLLCELTYEDLGFMRAGHRRRLFLYLHPQESITGALIKRATALVPPASTS